MKTWNEKLEVKKTAKVKFIDFPFADIPANSNMLVGTPQIIDAYIKNIPKGKSTSIAQMRKDLAIEYNADYTCPVSTAIFVRIVAEAAYEQYLVSKSLKNITPFWRLIEPLSNIAKKLSFGQEFLITQRTKEKIS